MPERTPLAKRSPSILVTDVRNAPSGGRSAPFVKAAKKQQPTQNSVAQYLSHARSSDKRQGSSNLQHISIENILSDSGDIPSAHRRPSHNVNASASANAPLNSGYGAAYQNNNYNGDSVRLQNHGSSSLSSSSSNSRGNTLQQTNAQSSKAIAAHGHGHSGPIRPGNRKAMNAPRLSQVIPPRTTKLSERLVLIPEDDALFNMDDGPNSSEDDEAERMPRSLRDDFYPRVTAYCISDGMRLKQTGEFLKKYHKTKPRIYDEALFALYSLPLLPGDGEGSRIKSSPGGVQLLEQLIDQNEQGDHHYEYYSGLETPREGSSFSENSETNANNGQEFDPYEPQHFSPRIHTEYLSQEESDPISGPEERYSNSRLKQKEAKESGEQEPVQQAAQQSEQPEQAQAHIEELQQDHQQSQKGPTSKSADSAVASTQSNTGEGTNPMHAELFIFSYGVIVFWNFTEHQEKDILADLTFAKDEHSHSSLVIRPINHGDIETEEMHFTYSEKTSRPRIYNDMITLKSGDHMIKLAMSHAIAQSTKLSRFEARMEENMHDVKHVPRMLALTGKLGMEREEVLKISGKLFKLRVDVNLSSNVLDTPEFFWEAEPSLNPLYSAIREYLEIEPRVLVLNERCKVFLELIDIITDSIAEYKMSRITWIIIILICLSLAVSALEITVRFYILKRHGQ